MFDGIKIETPETDPRRWLDDERLLFPLSVNERTGETIPQTRVSKYNGLIFKITPSRKSPGLHHCQIEGSLHKFFNDGRHNANDFRLQDVCNVVAILNNQFDVSNNGKLSNLEFGVNIELPIPVSKFLKMVVSMPERRFTQLDIEKIKVGKVCGKTDHHFKIYDKGLLSKSNKTNLLRVELSIKRMRVLEPFGIKTIHDLTDPAKVTGLGSYLAKMFSDVIMIDPAIYKNKLTAKELNKLRQYDNPRFWENLNKCSRYKHRQQFEALLDSANASQLKTTIVNSILQKWNELVNEQPKNGDHFRTFLDDKQQLKMATFSTLEYRRKKSPIVSLKIADKKYCKICGREITNQRAGSLFCSERIYGKEGKQCRNKSNGITRRDKLRQQREVESKLLARLQKINIKYQYQFCRLTYTNGATAESRLHQLQFTPRQIRQVNKITLTGRAASIVLTTNRAKEFLKFIVNLNLTIKHKKHEQQQKKESERPQVPG